MKLDLILFLAFAVIVAALAIRKGWMHDAPAWTISILRDISHGKFFYNRWHLHAILGPIALLFYWLLHKILEWWAAAIIDLFVCCVIAFTVEWVERWLGANRTAAQQFEADKDALFSDYIALIFIIFGILIFK